MEQLTNATAIMYLGIAVFTSIFAPLLITWLRGYITSYKKKKNPLKQALITNNKIEEQLDIIMEELECDRVWLAQFHNGGKFFPTGKSIQKFSVFYEQVVPPLETIQHTFQNIPCSLFPKALSKIYSNGHLRIENSKSDNSYDLEAFLKTCKAKSFYMYGLYDLEDRLIGVLSISYSNQRTLTLEEIDYVNTKLGVIGTLLGDYLSSKD